jgi:hypothetical protein
LSGRGQHDRLYAQRHRKEAVERALAWAKANPGRAAANKRAYELAKRRAMPTWLSEDHREQITHAYVIAAQIGYHVDHFIPLQGKNVCGLHVPWNLQLLPPRENIAKGNRCSSDG